MTKMMKIALVAGLAATVHAQTQAPVVISRTEPEYSDQARNAKWQGAVLLRVMVDETGVPQDIQVVRALGLGLDQKAIEAVQKWRFKPGMKDGKPVAVSANIEVNFRLPEAAVQELKANVAFNGQTFAFVSGQLVSGPTVKGAPYSAEAVNETVQTLADGNRIVQRTSAMQYRDSDGRERREETSAMGAIFITDPVAGVQYTLHPQSQTAEKVPLSVSSNAALPGGNFFVNNIVNVGGGGRGGSPQAITIALARSGGAQKTDQLGSMFIEGVQAQGTRTTSTIPAGDIGNDRPIDIVDERWYSPDLQMTVMTKHSDPRTGETSFRLSNINRSSPPPTLFEVPAYYTLGGGGRSGRE
jgi:TonB family protein